CHLRREAAAVILGEQLAEPSLRAEPFHDRRLKVFADDVPGGQMRVADVDRDEERDAAEREGEGALHAAASASRPRGARSPRHTAGKQLTDHRPQNGAYDKRPPMPMILPRLSLESARGPK